MKIGHDTGGSQTIISMTVTLKDEIPYSEQLVSEDRVEGRIVIDTTVFVREGDLVKVDVDANTITIAGGVGGNDIVKDKVEIASHPRFSPTPAFFCNLGGGNHAWR